MRFIAPLTAVIALVVLAFILVEAAGLEYLFGVVIPYVAVAIFFIGLVWRILKWARSPVPFRIPTTGGQQKSLPYFKQAKLDNPATPGQAFWRMVLEILCFRSLFRNTAMQYDPKGPRINYATSKWLWFFALIFHYSFLTVLLRHLRFFTEPIPGWVNFIEMLDGMLDITLPALLISGFVLGGAVSFLLVRRLYLSNIRYISLFSDYFPLLLILAIAATGILMRYLFKTDIVSVKEMTMGLVQFSPKLPEGVSSLFYVHVFLVSILFAYFPFSKLMHAGGVFLSPTRNLANNNRFERHENPWNYPVNIHTYDEYEDEFREQMVEAGLPVEHELEPEPEPEPEEEPAEAPSETAQEDTDSGEKQ